MKRYIIDTDIGDDIDDAFALDLALRKGLPLAGVTTVFRDTRTRAAIAKKLISLYGAEVPVYAGLGETMGGDRAVYPICQWTPDLGRAAYAPENSDPAEAVEFLVESAKKYGRDLVILAIGPLTNIAAAILKDRDAMLRSGGIVMMGGDFANHYAEWNIRCDVKAASVVFSSGIGIVAFGHEITSQTRLSASQQAHIFSMDGYGTYGPRAYLAELSRLWACSKPEGWPIVLHDALVVRYALEPAFCKTRLAPVAVETAGEYTCGMTVNLEKFEPCPGGIPLVRFACEVDIAEFLGYIMDQMGYIPKGENNVEATESSER